MRNDRYRPFMVGASVSLMPFSHDYLTEDYFRWMNDGEIVRYTESRFNPNSRERLRKYIDHVLEKPDTIMFAIVENENGIHVGNISLCFINRLHRFADVALIIGRKDFWGRGIATEAVSLVKEYAFKYQNLRKLTASCYADNKGSIRAFEKAGFHQEAVRKAQWFFEGYYVDDIMLACFLDDTQD